ncbi:MAG: SAF domain-containing protein [Corynebacterium sp.]|nr:SAF domain-containing protein [Corynebacterium sp.]
MTPGYRRTLLLRRIIAGLLLFSAIALALSSARDNPEVLVFAHDLSPGSEVTEADITIKRLPAAAIPSGNIPHSEVDIVGLVTASHVTAGEIVTMERFIGEELISVLVPEGNLVPLKLAEPAVAALLHHGDTVSVVTATDTASEVIAAGARVVSINAGTEQRASSTATVLLALAPHEAEAVAAASLSAPLTVVITGARAGYGS